MSVEHLKKQAKNAKPLLEAFRTQPLDGPIKLAQAQEFVARLNGYPDWHAALSKQKRESRRSIKDSDLWLLRYEEKAISDGKLVSTDIRIINGAADALGLLWHSFSDFANRQDVPGTPDRLTLSLADNTEPGCTGRQSLELSYAAMHRKIRITLSALDPQVLMLDGPYTEAAPSIVAALAQRDAGQEDMTAIYTAAREAFDLIQEELAEYHAENPTTELAMGFEDFLRAHMEKEAATQGPRDGIWTCQTWRLGRWRLCLKYLTSADDFYFDAFDESGGHGSFLLPTDQSAIKRKTSGQWVAASFKGSTPAAVALIEVSDDVMDELRNAARDWGIGFVVDGQTEFSPVAQGKAPGHVKFLGWLREKHPDALKGGRFDPEG